MPAIPEFVLRKLFVPGSLKPTEGGFDFQLNNTFAPVTLVGLALWADGDAVAIDGISLSLAGQAVRPAAVISVVQPLNLPVNELVRVRVLAPIPHKKLTLRAETREAGALQFSIALKAGSRDAQPGSAPIRRGLRQVAQTWRMLQIKNDPQRPVAHFTPQINWMNDPNGLIHWRGNYHLFYQYNPDRAAWGNIHWGHAVSKDLIHWKYLPIALAPSPDGPDAGGCFSGCAVQNGDEVALLYTGVYPEVQCLAVNRSADLTKWQKHPVPVIPAPPDGLKVEGFRDTCIWREGGEWCMTIGSGITGAGGAVLLYRSPDLKQWEYLGILYQGDAQAREPLWTGTMWECPSFFQLGEKWVLVISACCVESALYTLYFTGQYRDNHFIPDVGPRLLDFGAAGCFYAPQTFLDEHGRRLMIGWLREGRSVEAQLQAGWSGTMSLPRVLTLGADGSLCCTPVEETKRLRGGDRPWQAGELCGGRAELLLEGEPGNTWCGVRLAVSETAPERIEIGYDPETGSVVVDCTAVGGTLSRCPYSLSEATVRLHVFVDGSVIEVFVEDRLPIATRFYVADPGALRVWGVGSAAINMWRILRS